MSGGPGWGRRVRDRGGDRIVTEPSPPELPGHVFERVLGRGGFADVFLFRQELPARPVAIKVLREPVRTDADRLRFENEANRMAALSSHPGIVTIYAVGTAPDGRPFLSMEFCSRGHLGAIVAEQPLTVSRALEVGVKLAAGVETAHRASILHRDIKPANVLLTVYDEPALTDFGIAGGLGVGADDDVSHGVTIPFAAPEVTRDGIAGDETADVYSLGATVYALLAGRSPFQGPDVGSNAELLRRILAGSPPPTGRADVPASLEHVLATALRRVPGDRPDSALAFGRALQDVQVELGFDRTPMQLGGRATSAPVTRDPDDPDGTRLRPTARVDTDAGAAVGPSHARVGVRHRCCPPMISVRGRCGGVVGPSRPRSSRHRRSRIRRSGRPVVDVWWCRGSGCSWSWRRSCSFCCGWDPAVTTRPSRRPRLLRTSRSWPVDRLVPTGCGSNRMI